MDTNFYDVVICGAELGGMIAGALLARRGFRILLLGHDGDPPGFEAGGHVLSRAPGLLPPLEAPAVARILKELNYVQILRRRAAALSPSFQVVLPEHRLDVAINAAVIEREVEREFPREKAAVGGVLERMAAFSKTVGAMLDSDITLPPDGFWERREVARLESMLPPAGTDLLGPLPATHPMRAALTAPAALSGAIGPADLGAVATSRMFEVARRGLHRLEGGYTAVRGLFTDKIDTYSGEIREKVTPVEIMPKRGRGAGLRVRPRDETIGCNHLVWSGSLASMLRVLGDRPPRRLRELAVALRPVCYRYGLALLLRPDALPEGMGARVFMVIDPARPLLEENAFVVTVGEAAPRDPDRIPVWVECLVPAPAVDAGPGYLGALRARVRAQLRRLIPFWERHLVALGSAYDGLPPELPGAAAAGPPTAIPAVPLPAVYSTDFPRILDIGAVPHATGLKGLYLVGPENLPGLGLEGDFISGYGLARLITAAQPRKDLLRREVLLGES